MALSKEPTSWESKLSEILELGQLKTRAGNGGGGGWVQPETKRIMYTLAGILRKVLKDGDGPTKDVQIDSSCWGQGESQEKDDGNSINVFGSVRNGFGTKASDLDVNLQVPCGDSLNPAKDVKAIFEKLADHIVRKTLFTNVTRIFNANVPVLKLTDQQSAVEVDVCFNNYLAVINTKLLERYHSIDPRVGQLGRLVKEWAKKHELVGTADGFLNSYAYMLLVIQFLMTRKPAVLPNLQTLAEESKIVQDSKWGFKQDCDTKFLQDPEEAKKRLQTTNMEKFGEKASVNKETAYELFKAFFEFYASRRREEKKLADLPDKEKEEKLEEWDKDNPDVFNWSKHAVCIRLYEIGGPLLCKVASRGEPNGAFRRLMWANLPYIEDPFDLFHNLGEKCLDAPRNHILDKMLDAMDALMNKFSKECYDKVFPQLRSDCFLKFRVNTSMRKEEVAERFRSFNLRQIFWPQAGSGFAYIQFPDGKSRRIGHAQNQHQINGQSLNLHYSTEFSLKQEKDTMDELLIQQPTMVQPTVPQPQPILSQPRPLEQVGMDHFRIQANMKAASKAAQPQQPPKAGQPQPVEPNKAIGGAPGLQPPLPAPVQAVWGSERQVVSGRQSEAFPEAWAARQPVSRPPEGESFSQTLVSKMEVTQENRQKFQSTPEGLAFLEQVRFLHGVYSRGKSPHPTTSKATFYTKVHSASTAPPPPFE
mmetsp:Transcript_50984/g.119184  ORF Transcript_50984/g.119184 Transcript_50984/m.119184 type:complete len:703 (+) Transcript_50984:61-2169(+)